MKVLISLTKRRCLITGNEGFNFFCSNARIHTKKISNLSGESFVSKLFRFVRVQVKTSFEIIRNSGGVDIWIFFYGGAQSLLPLISAKLSNKKTVLLLPDAGPQESANLNQIIIFTLRCLATINYNITDRIVVYSSCLIRNWDLEKHHKKILIAHRHFLDFNTFTVTTPLSDRPPLIGYIGRLSGEKGVQHFGQALPAILSDRQDLHVLIGGDGQLKESIVASLQEAGLTARVDLPGWISHDDLPGYLNQLRLLVLPSYTEGLPNIMLEAMACGTPVLATPVGAIPDVIIDGKTGFIVENNSPECIAENVIRALNSPDLERIVENGGRFVEENFTFERVVERWKEVLEEI